MKTIKRFLPGALVMAAIAIGLSIVLVTAQTPPAAAPKFAGVVAAVTSTPPPGVIPLKTISGLTSLEAKVKISVNGLVIGKRTQGDLNAVLTTTDAGKSKVTTSGSLLGPIAAQVGGSLVGMFTPSSVDIYKVPDAAYIVVNSVIPVCVKPNLPDSAGALEELSPSSLLTMLTQSDVARGEFAGEETRNGQRVRHYIINGENFLTAAQNSSDPQLRDFAKALWSAKDAHLYVDAEGGHPVAFVGSFSGAFEPLKFEGDFDVQVELTGVNTNSRVDLPSACNKPISR